jgi:hypothetical protein
MELGMHITPCANIRTLLSEESFVLVKQYETILEVGLACLVHASREMLLHEWRVDADEMSTSQSGANRQIQFCATAEALIEAAEVPECLSPTHESAASEHAPTMTPVIVDKTEYIVSDEGAIGLRGLPTNAETPEPDCLRSRRHDIPIRVAQYSCARVRRLVVHNPSILPAHALRHALVVVVEEDNERPACLRQEGVQCAWKATIDPVANHPNFRVCSREPLKDAITSIRRSIIDHDDLPYRPGLHQRALHRVANRVSSVVTGDTKRNERVVQRGRILWKKTTPPDRVVVMVFIVFREPLP